MTRRWNFRNNSRFPALGLALEYYSWPSLARKVIQYQIPLGGWEDRGLRMVDPLLSFTLIGLGTGTGPWL